MRGMPGWIWMMIAVVAGLGATLMVMSLTKPAPPAAKSYVVVAAQPLAPGHPMDAKFLEVRQSAQSPVGSFARKEDLQQWEVAAPIKQGEIILKAALRPKSQGLADRVEKGKRAMTVKVDEATGVGGFPSPGDRVDVVFSIKPGRDEVKSGGSEVVAKNIKVLGYGSVLEKLTGLKLQPATTVTLEVSPEEAEHLARAVHEGTITLVLRNPDDQDKIVDPPPPQALADRVEKGKRAMTLKVDEASGMAGFLLPGNRVDVVLVMDKGEYAKYPIAKLFLQDLQVLGTDRKQHTVTLAVTPQEGVDLAWAGGSGGRISLVLRDSRGSDDKTAYKNWAGGSGGRISLVLWESQGSDDKTAYINKEERADARRFFGKPVSPPAPTVEIIRGIERESILPLDNK